MAAEPGAFTREYGDDLGAASSWDDESAAALRSAGFKIVRIGSTGVVYVGQVDYHDKPHGHGYMYLPNGDLHEGEFVEGRAHGSGTLTTHVGMEFKGQWEENKRCGEFRVTTGKGALWTEKYDGEGKRVGKKKVRVAVTNPDWTEGTTDPEVKPTIQVLAEPVGHAKKCWNCNHLSHPAGNHAWACRFHKGRWSEDRTYTGDGERPGVWSCCGHERHVEPGCAFREHNFMTS